MKMVECPFCGSKMDRNAEETKAYAAASEKEIETVTEHIEDFIFKRLKQPAERERYL